MKNGVVKVWRASFGRHLLLTNCLSCGGFFMVGDAIQQRIEMTQNHKQKFDLKRTLRLGLVGLSQVGQCWYSILLLRFKSLPKGPPHHYWYLYLDKFLPGKSLRTVNKKILADQLIAAPFFAITFIFGAGLLEGNNLRSCWSEFKTKFPTIYLFDWFFWPPSQGINFLFVPSQYRYRQLPSKQFTILMFRVLYVNGLTVLWDVFLSYIKHKPEAVDNASAHNSQKD